MTDPVEVLARSKCCLGPCELPRACDKRLWERAARHDIAVLESAGIRVVAVYSPAEYVGKWPGTAAMIDAGLDAFARAHKRHGPRESMMAAWNAMVAAAPTYGDKT